MTDSLIAMTTSNRYDALTSTYVVDDSEVEEDGNSTFANLQLSVEK